MKRVSIITVLILAAGLAFAQTDNKASPQPASGQLTLLELGSEGCPPCRAMQPIINQLRTELAGKVVVDYHDVWTDAGEPWARKYGIRVIPTQIFLDRTGREYYRHEGYFPKAEILKILQKGGLETGTTGK